MMLFLKAATAATLVIGGSSAPPTPHITPSVTLVKRSTAVRQLLRGSEKYFMRAVKLKRADKKALRARVGWVPESGAAKMYIGRKASGEEVGSAILVKVDSRHGPLALAVGFDPNGTVRQVIVTQATEETVPWVKKLLKTPFLKGFSGATKATAGDSLKNVGPTVSPMPRYMGAVITRGVLRALALREIAAATA